MKLSSISISDKNQQHYKF